MRIVFMGTPEFAVPCLEMLINEGYDIAAVVTQPDKPKGRGNKLTPPPVKEFALSKGIEVLQPEKVRTEEFDGQLRKLCPDLLVTAAYGKILPKNVLDIPPLGCVNVHGSLLPKYRGPAPIHWVIINGETETGITTMFSDIGMDTGDMLLKESLSIPEDMTVGELHDKMSSLGAKVLSGTLKMLEAGTLKRTPQPSEEATYAPIIDKEVGKIDWTQSAKAIRNRVRGTNPWPGAYGFYKGDRIRIWKTEVPEKSAAGAQPGTILTVGKDGMIVATGSGSIRVLEIQFDSGKRMRVEDYIRGHRLDEGEVLG